MTFGVLQKRAVSLEITLIFQRNKILIEDSRMFSSKPLVMDISSADFWMINLLYVIFFHAYRLNGKCAQELNCAHFLYSKLTKKWKFSCLKDNLRHHFFRDNLKDFFIHEIWNLPSCD